jgi:hypothetical protein
LLPTDEADVLDDRVISALVLAWSDTEGNIPHAFDRTIGNTVNCIIISPGGLVIRYKSAAIDHDCSTATNVDRTVADICYIFLVDV